MSNLNNNIEALFGKLENFVSTKTVVGEPVAIGDVIIVPLVDVSFGVGAGTIDTNEDKNSKETGAGGLGAKITPSAVMVIQNGTVQLVNVKNQDSVNKIIDMVPGIVSKLNFGSFFSRKENNESDDDDKKAEVTFEEERIVE